MKRSKLWHIVLLFGLFTVVSCEFDPESVNNPKLQRHIDSLIIVTYSPVQDSLRDYCKERRAQEVKIMTDSLVKRSIEDLIKLKPK